MSIPAGLSLGSLGGGGGGSNGVSPGGGATANMQQISSIKLENPNQSLLSGVSVSGASGAGGGATAPLNVSGGTAYYTCNSYTTSPPGSNEHLLTTAGSYSKSVSYVTW